MEKCYPPADELQAEVGTLPPNRGFVKMIRSDEIAELIEVAPLAFTLAATIALRARYQSGVSFKGLNPGEAFVGDYASYGMTRQQYRTAIGHLEKWKFITTKKTNRGTVARLINTRLFDVLNVTANLQVNQPPNQPPNQQPTSSQPLTKKDKKEKKGRILPADAGVADGKPEIVATE